MSISTSDFIICSVISKLIKFIYAPLPSQLFRIHRTNIKHCTGIFFHDSATITVLRAQNVNNFISPFCHGDIRRASLARHVCGGWPRQVESFIKRCKPLRQRTAEIDSRAIATIIVSRRVCLLSVFPQFFLRNASFPAVLVGMKWYIDTMLSNVVYV